MSFSINNKNIIFSPLEQFEIVTILPIQLTNFNLSLTNSSIFMLLVLIISIFWISLSFYNNTLIPSH